MGRGEGVGQRGGTVEGLGRRPRTGFAGLRLGVCPDDSGQRWWTGSRAPLGHYVFIEHLLCQALF